MTRLPTTEELEKCIEFVSENFSSEYGPIHLCAEFAVIVQAARRSLDASNAAVARR